MKKTTARKRKRVLGIIPARLQSTRLPQKMLLPINGKPLLYYTWRQVKKAKFLDAVVVATDSKEIFDAVVQFGGDAIMTSAKHQSGSDRVAEAARKFKGFSPEIVVNIQGDEPILSPSAIDAAASVLLNDASVTIGSVVSTFSDPADIEKPNFVKVVINKNKRVLYCSRSVIPFARNPYTKYWKQIGIYAFRKAALQRYVAMRQTSLELAEGLEQNRILENGIEIKVATGTFESVSVDTKEDFERVKALLEPRNS